MKQIELQNVSKTYQPGVPVRALCGVTLAIGEGEIVLFSGPSGSGKSTLFHLAGLIDYPDEGEIFIHGTRIRQDMKDRELTRLRRAHIGFIFQSFHLVPTLTVFENIEYPLFHVFPKARQRKETVREALTAVNLENYGDRYPHQLSGGQQQRISIARAFAKRPSIILADEPTANLDSVSGEAVVKLMERYNNEYKTTLLIASHDSHLLNRPSRQIRLKDGKIVLDHILKQNAKVLPENKKIS